MRVRLRRRNKATGEKSHPTVLESRIRNNSVAIHSEFDPNDEFTVEVHFDLDEILDFYLHAHRIHETHLKIF